MSHTRRPGELPPLPKPQEPLPQPIAPFPPAASAQPVPETAPPVAVAAPTPAPVAAAPAPAPPAPPAPEPRAEPADPLVGTTIGDRYKLVQRIGSGGFAAVYLSEHALLKKPMAVKVLLPELALDKDMVARFEREAVAAARLDHPNCVAITDFGRTDQEQLFLVMEYLDGRPLSELSGYGKRLGWERALEISRQILRGLSRAHELGIVHRDLKSSNIMILAHGARDLAKIIDFGIAKIFDGSSAGPHVETQAGIVFGTADFLAPERLLGKGDADPRSDLYSVGIILYEMLCGQRPFHEDDPYAIVKRALLEKPKPPRQVAPDAEIPGELEAAVLRALEKEPDQRYSSAREFLAALDPLGKRAVSTTGYVAGMAPERSRAGVGDVSPPVVTASTLPAEGRRRFRLPQWKASTWLWGAVGALTVLIIILAVAFSGGGSSSHPVDQMAMSKDRDDDKQVAELVAKAGKGATLEERERAFDRLVALGYYDRVPWVAKLSRDLEQQSTCEKRREVVAQLRNLKDPASIPALEKARDRKDNECLKTAAIQALAALGKSSPSDPEPEILEGSPQPAKRRSSGGGSSGGGHF
jgi:eukaryotic-like serine/threonine-protein kinase